MVALPASPALRQDDGDDFVDDDVNDDVNDDDTNDDDLGDNGGSPRSSNLPTSCLTSSSLSELWPTTKKCKIRSNGSWNSARLKRISPSLSIK